MEGEERDGDRKGRGERKVKVERKRKEGREGEKSEDEIEERGG